MQVRGLPADVIRGGVWASRLNTQPSHCEVFRRDALRRWRLARRGGLTAERAAEAVGVPVSTLYRWAKRPAPRSRAPRHRRRPTWSSDLIRAIERLRGDFPMWGKAKLAPLLRAEGFAVSESTVGRILRRLVARGVVQPVPLARKQARRGRGVRRKHARRLPKGLKANCPGGLVQLDTLTINPTGERTIKQFTAYDPVARFTVAAACRRATSRAAATFLDKLTDHLPFPVTAIQVDGGSEFMDAFEAACQARNIKLFVLPPKSPEINGGVERVNGTWRYEFYACYDLPHNLDELNTLIDSFAHLYNHHRPHNALKGQSPASYLQTITAQEAPLSLK